MPTQEQDGGGSVPGNIGEALQARGLAEIAETTRKDMASNPSTQQVDAEIAYRQGHEAEAIKSLSEAEQTICWKFRMSAGEYVRGKK